MKETPEELKRLGSMISIPKELFEEPARMRHGPCCARPRAQNSSIRCTYRGAAIRHRLLRTMSHALSPAVLHTLPRGMRLPVA